MTFKSDIERIVREWLDQQAIRYDQGLDTETLVARYLEMLNRRIEPKPREVHFSDEIHDSLGTLLRETHPDQQRKAVTAWGTVFFLYHEFVQGHNVNRFLSRRIRLLEKGDGLLWDWGIQHLHLNRAIESDGFVKRSDYLLFAIVAENDVYFVDVRTHSKPGRLEWVRQDLLQIVHSNWPHLTKDHKMAHGSGESLTDEQVKELRRKNMNYASAVDGDALLPIGGGTMADGSSAVCRVAAMRLLHEIDAHQEYFDTNRQEVADGLASAGIDGEQPRFELVSLDSIERPEKVVQALREDSCFSNVLAGFGFVIVESATRKPIVVTVENETPDPP